MQWFFAPFLSLFSILYHLKKIEVIGVHVMYGLSWKFDAIWICSENWCKGMNLWRVQSLENGLKFCCFVMHIMIILYVSVNLQFPDPSCFRWDLFWKPFAENNFWMCLCRLWIYVQTTELFKNLFFFITIWGWTDSQSTLCEGFDCFAWVMWYLTSKDIATVSSTHKNVQICHFQIFSTY